MTPVRATVSNPSLSSPSRTRSAFVSDTAILIYIALATVVIHVLTGNRYGFHRDELATLEDARHLAWGYVAYPPVTPFFGRLSLILFGTSLAGFRFFAAVAQAATVLLAGLMARELGGRRGSQLIAAAAAVPFCLAGGALMQYVAFDALCWVLTAYFVLRLLKSGNPRWWLAIGFSVGLGFMSKYAIAFFLAGLLVGLLITPLRGHLGNRWFWLGAAVLLLVFLPNVIWQMQHGFVSLDFLRSIHARDVRLGRTRGFLTFQLELMLFSLPLAAAGLYFYLLSEAGKRFRILGSMYVIPLVLFVVAKGRGYYLAAAYPMLYAAGSVWGEQRLASFSHRWRSTFRIFVWAGVSGNIFLTAIAFLPMAPINSNWWNSIVQVNGDLREEIGWPELVQTVAQIRDSLSPDDRAKLGILAGNYGEAGAVNLYGPRYGLPRAISGINSFWQRGYGDPPPQTLIALGFSRDDLEKKFSFCEVVAHTWNRYGVRNEETVDHPDIFVCRGLRQSWPDFWKEFRYYG